MKRLTKETLKRWGVQVVERPDIFDNRNRCVTVVIDERNNDRVVFLDALTISTSSETLDEIVCCISGQIYEGFISNFIHAVNAYGKWMKVILKQESGLNWWKNAIDRVDFVLDAYGIQLKHCTKLDYIRMIETFGMNGFTQLLTDAVCFNISELPKCYFCKHCQTNRKGERRCNRCYVPVENGQGVKTLRMISDTPISNQIVDILPTFESREECSEFERRNTSFIDWAVRFRNAHFLNRL